MSDYCDGCRYEPGVRAGESACPVTTFYWDFLDRNRERLEPVRRMRFSLNNLDRLPETELQRVRARAAMLRRDWGMLPRPVRTRDPSADAGGDPSH